jgi:HK97 gp10 family phage protein
VYGPGAKADGYYADMVEYGTISQPAQPFVRPALQAVQGEVLKIAVAKFKAYIEEYNRQA